MDIFKIALTASTLLCSLVAGIVLAFTIVVMPGIKSLSDRDFLQAFKVMDRVIQDNQPVFMIVWLGSIVALVTAGLAGFTQLHGAERLLLIAAAAIYLVGVQLPTVAINIPLNNRLQQHDLGDMTELALRKARVAFEPRWVRWNIIRTALATLVSLLLVLLVFRL